MSTAASNYRYRLKHADAQKERDHRRYMRQREERLAYQREYYAEHREEIRYKKRMGLVR
jgi:hypothetical protein